MATLTSTKILRDLAGKNARIYNDKLKDGTRSYKVECYPNWKDTDYHCAEAALLAAGINAKVVVLTSVSYGAAYRQVRLHVKE